MGDLFYILAESTANNGSAKTLIDSIARLMVALEVTGWRAVVTILGGGALWGYIHALKSAVGLRRDSRRERKESD